MKSKVLTAILCTFVLSSCGGHVTEGVSAADEFINAYMAADYEKAALYCNDYVREAVQESAAMLEELDSLLLESFMEISAQMEPRRTGVFEHTKDSIVVDYDVLIPGEIEPIHNAVTVRYDSSAQKWEVVDVI